MAVAQNDGFQISKIKLQGAGVWNQQIALAGVKQSPMRSELNVPRQTVFRPQAACVHAVFQQDGNLNFAGHGRSMNLAVAVALTQSPCFSSAASINSGDNERVIQARIRISSPIATGSR